MNDKSKTIELGTGVLTWNRDERVTDRYGSVWLMLDGTEASVLKSHVTACVTGKGTLCVEVIESRKSPHIGDFFCGIAPKQTEAGKVVELGKGNFFQNITDAILSVGVAPVDGRKHDWLDIKSLYAVHNHLVRLFFVKE